MLRKYLLILSVIIGTLPSPAAAYDPELDLVAYLTDNGNVSVRFLSKHHNPKTDLSYYLFDRTFSNGTYSTVVAAVHPEKQYWQVLYEGTGFLIPQVHPMLISNIPLRSLESIVYDYLEDRITLAGGKQSYQQILNRSSEPIGGLTADTLRQMGFNVP